MKNKKDTYRIDLLILLRRVNQGTATTEEREGAIKHLTSKYNVK